MRKQEVIDAIKASIIDCDRSAVETDSRVAAEYYEGKANAFYFALKWVKEITELD